MENEDRLSGPLKKFNDEDVKYEVDVSFGKALDIRTYYSFSCSSKGDTFPKKISATKSSLKSTMARYTFRKPIINGVENEQGA